LYLHNSHAIFGGRVNKGTFMARNMRWIALFILIPMGCGAARAEAQRISPPPQSAASSSGEDAETHLRNALAAQVSELWAKADFAGLDSMADSYIQTKERTLSGKWRLSIFYGALSELLAISWPNDGYLTDESGSCACKRPIPSKFDVAEGEWDHVYLKIGQWIHRYPNSPHARIVQAQFFVNRAWFFRGSGYSSTVTKEAWPLVSQYIADARKSLIECRSSCSADPHWYEIMFFVASAESWSHEQIGDLVHDLVEHGQSYVPAYQSAARLLLPKWSGSYEDVETFARIATTRNEKIEGNAMYARIYWNLGESPTLFTQSRADWPTMKRGFEAMLAKYPDPRNLNGEAMFSCAAGDGATYQSVMKQLGNRVIPSIWVVDLNYCQTRFGAT
jgi:Domain of unknown function (DUF4034)